MSNVIIFGLNDFAELAYYYLKNDSLHNVVAFSVNRSHLPDFNTYNGLPIVAFEDIVSIYPPTSFHFFAPMSPKKMNMHRKNIFLKIRDLGYRMISYVSTKATTYENIIGENCFILEDCTLQPFSRIGSNVTIWSGTHLGHHSKISDHVTVTSHVVISGHCNIEDNCFVGVNSTLRDGITLAEGSFISMSTTMTNNSDPWSVYKGNPAIKMRMSSLRLNF